MTEASRLQYSCIIPGNAPISPRFPLYARNSGLVSLSPSRGFRGSSLAWPSLAPPIATPARFPTTAARRCDRAC
jgi:hypothetical protein